MERKILTFLIISFLWGCGPYIPFLVKNGDINTVKKLIADGYDVSDEDNMGILFRSAVIEGKTDIVEYLIENYKPDVNYRSYNNNTPLMYAADYKHNVIVKLLLDEGADYNMKNDYGRTALIYAAMQDNETTIDLLLDKNPVIDVKDINGMTARMWAIANGNKYASEKLKYYNKIDKYKGDPMLIGGQSTFTMVKKNAVGEMGIVYIIAVDDENYDWVRNIELTPGFHLVTCIVKSAGFVSSEISFPVSAEKSKIYLIEPIFDLTRDQVELEITPKD